MSKENVNSNCRMFLQYFLSLLRYRFKSIFYLTDERSRLALRREIRLKNFLPSKQQNTQSYT
jgi:hypothetical protein